MKSFIPVFVLLLLVGCSGGPGRFSHKPTPARGVYFGSSSYGLPASKVQPEVRNTGGIEITRSPGRYQIEIDPKDLTYIGGFDLPPPVAGARMVVVETITTPAVDLTVDYPWWFDVPWPNYRVAPGSVPPGYVEGNPPPLPPARW